MTKTHTPGVIAGYKFTEHESALGLTVDVVAPDGKAIVTCGGGTPAGARYRAHEAAYADYGRRFAPGAMDALKECVEVLKDLPQGHSEARIVALNAARAAIQKAEGKE